MSRGDGIDRDVDIVQVILHLVQLRLPITPEQVREIEQEARMRYGGQRARIAKRKKHLTTDERQKIVSQALSQSFAELSTDDVAQAIDVPRRTLYRYLKRGGPG